jgi:hypothetical protein
MAGKFRMGVVMRISKQWRGFVLLEMAMLYFLEIVLLILASDIVAAGQDDAARFGISVLICCAMAGAALLVFYTGKWSKLTLGFAAENIGKQILLGLILAIFLFITTAAIHTCFGWLSPAIDSGVFASFPLHSRPLTPFTLYRSCYLFLFGIVQEIIFMGYFYSRIQILTNLPWLPVVGAAFLFTLFQYPIYPQVGELIGFFLIGLFLGGCRLKLRDCSLLTVSLAGGLYSMWCYLL